MNERDDKKPLFGTVQVDDAYWGKELNVEKRGRNAEGKAPFIAVVQTNEVGRPIAMWFTELKGFRKTEIAQWVKRHVTVSSLIVSDGLSCFSGVKKAGCQHQSIVKEGGLDSIKIEAFTVSV